MAITMDCRLRFLTTGFSLYSDMPVLWHESLLGSGRRNGGGLDGCPLWEAWPFDKMGA